MATQQTPSNALPFAGRVLASEDESPLPGAHVYVTRGGQHFGVVTDADGLYYMDQAAPGEDVFVRFVGRTTEVFTVPRDTLQMYTHRLRPSAELAEFEVFGDKPDPGGVEITPPAPRAGLGWWLAGAAALLLLANSTGSNRPNR